MCLLFIAPSPSFLSPIQLCRQYWMLLNSIVFVLSMFNEMRKLNGINQKLPMLKVKMKKKREREQLFDVQLICDYKSSVGLSKSKSYDRSIPFEIHSKRDCCSTLFYLLFLPPPLFSYDDDYIVCTGWCMSAAYTYSNVCLFVRLFVCVRQPILKYEWFVCLLVCFYCMA